MSTYKKKEAVVRIPFDPKFPPSEEQKAFFEASKYGDDNLHLDAKAGSGKSTTLVWEMALSDKRKKSAMMAFNTSIVEEIEPKCAMNVTVKTCHSFGYQALASSVGRPFLDKYKTEKILKEYRWLNPDGFSGPEKQKVISRLLDTVNLVDKIKVTLTDEKDEDAIESLMYRYRIEIDMASAVMEILPEVFEKMTIQPNIIDFADMMWLPIKLNLPIPTFEKLYIDEAQDFNALMIAYAQRMKGGRVVTVGDRRQSIYGFAGADTNSIEKLTAAFESKSLPLNTCYRCGSSIIAEAQRIVPEIVAHSSTGEGVVNRLDKLPLDIEEGAMVLSRRNAKLVGPCFQLLKAGKKAVIKGRDIGTGLVRLLESLKADDVDELIMKVDEWMTMKIEKAMKNPKFSVSMIEGVQDQADCLKAIAEECSTIPEIKFRIETLFSEDRKGIVLSSIHRSKGLEASHVAIVDYANVRLNNDKMTMEDHHQEANLEYVALTRAKHRLDLVS